MRYPAAEKIEIIRLVEQSNLSVRRTLEQIGVPRATFYRWYDQYQTGGPEALEDRPGRPSRVWNRIPEEVRAAILEMALEHSELSPRELAAGFTDSQGYFVSEASVYRLLKAHDLITSPAFIVMKAAKAFSDKTTAPNQMWQAASSAFDFRAIARPRHITARARHMIVRIRTEPVGWEVFSSRTMSMAKHWLSPPRPASAAGRPSR